MNEKDAPNGHISNEDIHGEIRKVKHSVANLEQRQSILERMFVGEFGDGDRPGALGVRLESFEKTIEALIKKFGKIEEALNGDGGDKPGLAEKVRGHERNFNRMDKHLWFFYSAVIALLAAAIKVFLN